MADEETPQDASLVLAQKLFLFSSDSTSDEDKSALELEIKAAIDKDYMVSLYISLCERYGWMLDDDYCKKLNDSIATELQTLNDKIKDAEENLGESEVRQAELEKALFYIRIGDKANALKQLDFTETKTVAIGLKMDLVFHSLRLAFFHCDFELLQQNIDKAKTLFESGGDWERKNRLKVYEGLFCIAIRDFKKATLLFLDAISTFGAYELFPYESFVFYTVLCSIVSLDRVTLKEKVIDSPEILTMIDKIPHLSGLLNSLYNCKYNLFFISLASISPAIKLDRFLAPHYRFYLREIRVVAYSQFLESYKSVTVAAMSKAFGVSPSFLDWELSSFIVDGRLNCKIDKVVGVLETNRPDSKNSLYQEVVKQGDLLLNRIQRLSKVIDV